MIQILANSLIDGFYIAILAICFGLIYNTLKVFHFAFGAFLVLSSYLIYQGFGYFSYLIIGLLIGLIDIYIYYPLTKRNSTSAVSIISSLGIYIVIINIVALFWGNDTKLFGEGIQRTYEFLGIVLTRYQLEILYFSIIFILLFLLILRSSVIGNKIIAVGENPFLARSIGINVKLIRIIVIITTTCISSFISSLKSMDVGLDPYIGLGATLTAAVAFIVSGGKNYNYIIVAGILLGILRNLSTWFFSAQWMDAITFIVLILFLLYRNKGIFVEARRLEESI